jgi:uroporphyrinogen-III synthase
MARSWCRHGALLPIPFVPRGRAGVRDGQRSADERERVERARVVARIVVTRPAGREQPLVDRLTDAGHDVVHVPLVAIEPLGDEPVDVEEYDWVVLTSATGARELRRRMRGRPRRVAAIGHATAEAFGGADLVATTSTQEGLLAALPSSPGRVLFAGAEGARRLLPQTLHADMAVLYRTVELTPSEWPDCDLVVLTSASAARALGRASPGARVVSIGPETSRAADEAGLSLLAEAETSDVAGLAAAVERAVPAS